MEEAYNNLILKLEEWLIQVVAMIPNLVLSILVFYFFYRLSIYGKKLAGHFFNKFSQNTALNRLFSLCVRLIILFAGLFWALEILHLEKTVTSLLAGAGIIGLALSFAFQDLVSNFIAGTFMALKSPFQVNDFVETAGYTGFVEMIDLRLSAIRTLEGQLIYIPNKEIFQNPIVNYSELGRRRVDIFVGVSYADDLRKVRDISIKAIEKLEFVRPHSPVRVIYNQFGDSSINFRLEFWINFPGQYDFFECQSSAIIAIKEAFDEADISIPFPIRTLDFDIKGGENLSDTLARVKGAKNGDAS